jgi:hypothetical protein
MTAVDGVGLTSTLPEMLIAISCMHEMPIHERAMPVFLTATSSPPVVLPFVLVCFLAFCVAVCLSTRPPTDCASPFRESFQPPICFSTASIALVHVHVPGTLRFIGSDERAFSLHRPKYT